MALLGMTGFELQTLATNVEIDNTGGSTTAPTISTTTVRSGAASMSCNVAAGTSFAKWMYRAASVNQVFVRIYFNIATALTGAGGGSTLLSVLSGSISGGGVVLLNNSTLILIDGAGVTLGSPSSIVPANEWHYLELSYDDSVANNTLVARLDGVQFATGNGTNLGGNDTIWFGLIDTISGKVFLDDIVINDNQGTNVTSFVGNDQVICLIPDSAGDVNTFGTQTGGTLGAANNFTRVNEVIPDDATTFNGSSTLNQEDLFNTGNPGIGEGDIVNAVQVNLRFRNSTADATAVIKAEIEKKATGTITQSTGIIPNSITWRTNTTANPMTPVLTLYTDPDSVAWNKQSLNQTQLGYKLTTAPGTAGRRIDVTKIWLYALVTPRPPRATRLLMGVGI